jgi:hypothetical protein
MACGSFSLSIEYSTLTFKVSKPYQSAHEEADSKKEETKQKYKTKIENKNRK